MILKDFGTGFSNPRPLIAPSPNPLSRLLGHMKNKANSSVLYDKNSPTSSWVMSPIDSNSNQHEVWQSLRNTAEPPISRIYCLAKAFVSHTELHEYVP